MRYTLTDITLDLQIERSQLSARMRRFASEASMHDLLYQFVYTEDFSPPNGQAYGNAGGRRVVRAANAWFLCADDPGRLPCILQADSEWKTCRVHITPQSLRNVPAAFRDDPDFWVRRTLFQTVRELFQVSVIAQDALYLHGVLLQYSGAGIVFSAPSGGGKSTHTALWKQAFGGQVSILNGDNCVLRKRGAAVYAFGVPWSGNSEFYLNRCVPLRAVVLLEKATENQVLRLDVQEAFTCLMRRCFLPFWDGALRLHGLTTLGGFLESVPVYLLRCTPECESALLLQNRLRQDGLL